jgi:hypothetical protein
MARSKPYTPPARIWRALQLADILDASGIDSGSAMAMDDTQWGMLATAAGCRTPSLMTRNLIIEFLRNREDVRSMLERRTYATNEPPAPTGRQVIQIPRH